MVDDRDVTTRWLGTHGLKSGNHEIWECVSKLHIELGLALCSQIWKQLTTVISQTSDSKPWELETGYIPECKLLDQTSFKMVGTVEKCSTRAVARLGCNWMLGSKIWFWCLGKPDRKPCIQQPQRKKIYSTPIEILNQKQTFVSSWQGSSTYTAHRELKFEWTQKQSNPPRNSTIRFLRGNQRRLGWTVSC